jgi:hypothetical protein
VTSERGNFVGTSLEATSMVPIKRSIDAQREKKARGIKSSTNDTVLRFTRTHPTAVRPDACYSRPKRRAAALESPTRTAPVSSRQRPSPRPSAEPSARRTLLLRPSLSGTEILIISARNKFVARRTRHPSRPLRHILREFLHP